MTTEEVRSFEMTNQIFSITAHGEKWVAFKDARGVYWTLDKNDNIQPMLAMDITDLTPVETYDPKTHKITDIGDLRRCFVDYSEFINPSLVKGGE